MAISSTRDIPPLGGRSSRVSLMVRGRQNVNARAPRAGETGGAFPLAKAANSVSYAPRI
jgi:hypothetical protein